VRSRSARPGRRERARTVRRSAGKRLPPPPWYRRGPVKKRKSPGEPAASRPSTPFNNPFAALGRPEPPSTPSPSPAPTPAAAAPAPVAPAEAPPARAVIRYQRKGRGGKEVTVVEQLGLPPARLQAWL